MVHEDQLKKTRPPYKNTVFHVVLYSDVPIIELHYKQLRKTEY